MNKRTKIYIVADGGNSDIQFELKPELGDDTLAHRQKRHAFYTQEVAHIKEFDPEMVFIMSGWEVGTDYIYGQFFPLIEEWALKTGRPVIVQTPSYGVSNEIFDGRYPWVKFEESKSFDIVNMGVTKQYLQQQIDLGISPPLPSKLFVCYNNRPCNYRTKMVDNLAKHDLLKDGVTTYKRGVVDQDALSDFKYYNVEDGPSLIDEEEFELHKTIEHDGITHTFEAYDFPRQYHTGLIDIVTESRIDEGEYQMTEKTNRPIAALKPFLILGAAGCHQWLKDTRGIEMYDEIFDYAFDSNWNLDARVEAICENVKRIRNEDPIKIMAKVKDKVEHNLHTYIKLIENMEYSFPPSIKNLITLNDYCRLDIKCGNEHGLQDLFIYINHWENYGGVYSGANMPWYKIDQPEYRYKPLVTKP